MIDTVESLYGRRQKIYNAAQAGWNDIRVAHLFFENGEGTNDEAPLWDYKRDLPLAPLFKNEGLNRAHDAKMAEIVKDAVAFFNSHGGYIVAGVDDKTRSILGFDDNFDAADLNKRIHGATGISVETVYRTIEIDEISPGRKIGILFIPRRGNGVNPAQFRRRAPANNNGKYAYEADSYYFRERDNCRPASGPEDYGFLYGPRTFGYTVSANLFLDNNLPARDPELVQLFGRKNELTALWSWLADNFSPVKILSGLGGVGKTSISYTFAEHLIDGAPSHIDRLIWLGAKEETFSGEQNRDVATSRIDFDTIESLLEQILLEAGCPPQQIPEAATQRELLELCSEHLAAHNYILIVDNVDSLPDAEQQLVFHLLTQICSPSKTKCIITARRNLGAPRSIVIEVGGLDREDFASFVGDKCLSLNVKAPLPDSKEMDQFFEASGGSPLFALSILRLLALGDSLKEAINHWKGNDGVSVRDAAFKREVGRLKGNEARVLLALCYKKKASVVELASLLGLTRYEVQNALEELQSFSMTSIDTSLPGGSTFKLHKTLKLVTSIVEQRVKDNEDIKSACALSAEISKNQKPYIADAVIRTISYLNVNEPKQALNVVDLALRTLPESADLLCLKGRCLIEDGNLSRAKEIFQQAYDQGCRKRELFFGWITANERQEDWKGIIGVADLAEPHSRGAKFTLARSTAQARLGDERCRVGDYHGAVTLYETALEAVCQALTMHTSYSDRSELQKQRELLAVSWLGAVQQIALKDSDDGRRRFGAYYKAVTLYKLQTKHAVASSLGVLNEWLGKIERRKSLSPTAREHLSVAQNRLINLKRVAHSNPAFSEESVTELDKAFSVVQIRLSSALEN